MSQTINEVLSQAVQAHQSGDLEQAESFYRQVLQQDANHPDALHLLGVLMSQLQSWQSATQFFERAILAQPNEVLYYINYAEMFLNQNKLEEAAECFQKILTVQPDLFAVHNNLANLFVKLEQTDKAILHYQKALLIQPEFGKAHYNLGNMFKMQGKLLEAEQSYRKALQIDPADPMSLNNLGIVLKEQGRIEEAIEQYQLALQQKSDSPEAQTNLGNILKDRGQFEEAIVCYQEAIRLNPDICESYSNLATVYKDQGRLTEAMETFKKAVTVDPNNANVFSNMIYAEQFLPDISLAQIRSSHQAWQDRFAAQPVFSHVYEKNPDKKLTLGFVSADFRVHPVAYFTVGILENLARHCDVVCYANQPLYYDDEMTERFKQSASHWHNIHGWTDAQVAEKIREDKIDILFDLTGHNAGNRLMVFAQKPAPVQITWAGYMATTGLSAMDYILGDAYETPESAAPYYSEKIIRMPHSFIAYDPPDWAPPVNVLPALTNGYLTFGSFNILAKITPAVVALWSDVLNALQSSKLIMKTKGLSCDKTRQRYLDMFEAHGISSDRITCYPFSSREELGQNYQQVDIQLDPFPFSGSTTTLESLWMGVPVITLPGETFAGRHSLTFLSNAGLSQFVATDQQHYINMAIYWNQHFQELDEIRQSLRSQMQQSPLCNAEAFAQELLDALNMNIGFGL